MSKKRQPHPDDLVDVRTYAVTHPPGLDIGARAFEWDQLVYASQGVMTVTTSQGAWVVPPHRAVWVPAGVTHAVAMSGRVSVRTLFFKRGRARGMPAQCRAVNVSPLLREVILETVRKGVLRRDVPAERRLAGVLLDCLHAVEVAPLQLPMPLDPRGRAAAALLHAAPSRSTARVARAAGASQRTLERIFKRETHMTFGRWRQRLRLVHALRLLAMGHAVTRVAVDVGYDSPSAFIHAFRMELGATPARYFAAR